MKLLFRRVALRGVALLCCLQAAGAKPTDPAADYLIDLSGTAGEPCAIRIATDRNYWQLPAEQIRRGYGIGLFSIARNTTNNCEARIYVEVEEIGASTLDAAVDQAIANLPGLLEPLQVKVEGEVTRDRVSQHKIGGTSVEGAKVRYAVKVLNADPVTVDPTTALFFRLKGALVSVTVENYASSTVDHFSRFLKMVSIGKPPGPGGSWRLKMVDATAGTYRYFETPMPAGMAPERSDQLEGNAIGFCRVEDGKPAMRIRIAKSETDKPMEEKEDADFRHSDLLDMYDGTSGLEEIPFGGGKAWLCTATDGSVKPPRRLAILYFRPHRLMWTWTMDSDEAGFEKNLAAFKGIAKTFNYWAGQAR